MKKKEINDEIDLVDFIIIIWKKKLIVSLFIISSLIITFTVQLYQSPSKQVATTEIRKISVYDEAKYEIYNLFINTITPSYMEKRISESNIEKIKLGARSKDITVVNQSQESLVINNIKKKFLFKLFLDLIRDKSFIRQTLKESQFIQKENYSNMFEYNKAINEMLYSIDFLNIELQDLDNNSTPVIIEFVSTDMQKWENFLEYLEKQMNIQIQKKLTDMLSGYINYVNSIKKFKISDLDTQLEAANIEEAKRFELVRQKETLKNDKYVSRLKDIFSSSPLANEDDFYAATILTSSTKYELADERASKFLVFIIAGLLGAIIGIFFALLASAIQNRR